MPIGVPRIIYCWGEELPAQWTDIYNFIFRRRMVFLMQYLDDELCNQICGLLINIHMEDRSKELEKKETERSGVLKSSTKPGTQRKDGDVKGGADTTSAFSNKKQRSMEDLLNSDEDLGIQESSSLEQYTLQKITTEWLNWNAQFFDYSDEPYLFYLAELLSKDFQNNEAKNAFNAVKPNAGSNKEISQLLQMLKTKGKNVFRGAEQNDFSAAEVYSPFRTHAKFDAKDYSLKDLNTLAGKEKLLQMFNQYRQTVKHSSLNGHGKTTQGFEAREKAIHTFLQSLSSKDFGQKVTHPNFDSNSLQNFNQFSEKVLSQRDLRSDYTFENNFSKTARFSAEGSQTRGKAFSYLDSSLATQNNDYNEFRSYYRKQTERAFIEEESKKVFVIINSFGGSVGNGVTVHDALQFIKAGSLTLGLGVAASAASLALAGGTIGERYVTEGCHVMIHQPEGGLQGQASDIWIDSQEIMKIRLDVAEIYSLSTYRPRHKILRDLDRDFYLNASETIYYGLADEIATNEVMHSIIEETNRVWDYHDSKQQSLLEARVRVQDPSQTQTDVGG
jgi:ATP-dependent Clp protease protease subunit